MKIKNLFSRRVTSLLLVFLLAFTMLPTGALAAEVTDETHVHTEECSHEESVETLDVVEDETVISEPAAETYEITSDTEVTEVNEETEETTEDVTETETAEDATSGYIKESSVEWSYDSSSGRLIISGSGDCAEFTSADDQPWIAYRNQITEVWFYDMDALSISNIAYWFDGCSALTMAEIPYTTQVIGTRAFADCPNLTVLQFYYYDTDVFAISPMAFYTDSLVDTSLRVVTEQQLAVLKIAMYDWATDNRSISVVDAYSASTLSDCCLSDCSCSSCGWYYNYVSYNSSKHNTWVCCTNCSAAFLLSQDAHSFSSNGYCSDCGYYNSSYDTSICYHTSTYYSWSGCTYYEYCSNCGEYISSGTSHGSTYTEWSGCDWYEYCRDCDELMDSGTSHGSYSYGAWEYYNSSRHRRYYSCDDCGEGSYSYGYHSTTTTYTQYSSTQHKYGKYCSTCGSYVGSTSYGDHTYTYGSWSNYSSTQHRRTKTCSLCGYSTYEYASHSLSYGNWTSDSSTQHKRTVSCSCGYSTTEYASHSLSYGDWTTCEGTNYSSKHQRTVSCSCGYSTVEYEDHSCYGVTEWEYYDTSYHKRYESCDCGYNRYLYDYHSYTTSLESASDTEHSVIKTCSDCGHSTTTTEAHSFIYGDWSSCSDTQHQRTVSCSCGYSGTEYGDHTDEDDDGYCDDCSYLMARFSVTVPANLSLTVSKNGEVYSATSAEIMNNSTGAVAVTSIVVSAENGWSLAPYSTNMANEKVDTKQIGFSINGAETVNSGSTETLNLSDNWTIAKSDSLALSYDAVVSAMSDPVSEQVLTIVFVVDWAA